MGLKASKFLLIFIVVLTAASCASSATLYKKGRYDEAVTKAVKKLRSSPNHAQSQEALIQAYPMAVTTALRDIENALQSNSITRYDVAIARYELLHRLAGEIYSCPKAFELIPSPQEFHDELRQTKEIAAGHYYDLGIKALDEKTQKQAELAHNYFTKANEYVNGYRDVVSKIEEALFAATLRVVFETPRLPERYQLSADFFFLNLVTEMQRTNKKEFLHFYSSEEFQGPGTNNQNQYIVLDFLDFMVGVASESRRSQEVRRENVPVTVRVGGQLTTAYITATANLTTYRREVVSGGKLHVRIMDAKDNRIIEQHTFEGSYTWTDNWASYTGDDRALSEEQKWLAAKQPSLPPSNQELFNEYATPLYSQVLSCLQRAYY